MDPGNSVGKELSEREHGSGEQAERAQNHVRSGHIGRFV
jgi:hypothetical protein